MNTNLKKLVWFFRRRQKEEELREELQFHLDEEDGDRRALGNLTLIQEDTRAAWGWVWIEQLAQDLRYALRAMRRNPGFTLLAAASLALGIGANTAIYSFMDAVLLRELPVQDPASLAVLNWHMSGKKVLHGSVLHDVQGYHWTDPKLGRVSGIFPYPAFELLRKSSDAFAVLVAYHPAGKLNLMVNGGAEVADGEYVSGDYFRGLGVVPAAGRLIAGDDDRAGAQAVAVLSFGFAERRFGDASRAAGENVSINNLPFTVIGVAPPGFFGVDPSAAPDFYLPLHADLLLDAVRSDYADEHYYWIEMMARLRPGVTRAQAQAIAGPRFDAWVAGTAHTDTERNNLPEFVLNDGSAGLSNLRREYSGPLWLLLAMVGLILAIACANIASLLLARGTARIRDMAVRLSVGASRGRVIRQLLTESVLLASIGGAAGVLVAMWGVRALVALLGDDFTPRVDLNWHVLLAASALSVITGIAFGLAPAVQATRVDAMPALKGSRIEGRTLRFGLGNLLTVAQVAISMILLIGAGWFVRTLANLHSIELGFRRENLLVFRLNARQAGYHDPQIISFYRDLQSRFASIPGVENVAQANSPLIAEEAWGWPVVPIDKRLPEDAPSGHGTMTETATHVLAIGPGFFSTMKIPILAGREFDDRDRQGTAPVAIVSEVWARVNLPLVKSPQELIGRTVVSLVPRGRPEQMEIVGVAKNARYDQLTGDFPATVYMPFEQSLNVPVAEMTFFLRTAGDPLRVANSVRQIVSQADSRIPVTNLTTQAAAIDDELRQEILFARLSTGFSILALVIATVGLYGTMSYTVARRWGEIGIRMALGARGPRVVR